MKHKLSPLATPSLIVEGLRLLSHRQIRWLVLFPIVINIALFATVTWSAGLWVSGWLDQLTTSVPDWLQWLAWIIWLLFALLILVVFAFTFTLFANLIGSPFYGIIAERIIALELGTGERTTGTPLHCWPQPVTVFSGITDSGLYAAANHCGVTGNLCYRLYSAGEFSCSPAGGQLGGVDPGFNILIIRGILIR